MSVPYWASDDGDVVLHLGKCEDVLPLLPAGSVDAVATDPPYELGFMGRSWDARGVAYDVDVWRECLRVLKPGGHLLAFGGTRTWHRMVCAIEDAGFEIRDAVADLTGYDAPGLMWVYGTGFPKSLDVSKAIDKLKRRDYVLTAIELGLEVPGNNLHDWTKAEHSPGDEWWERFKAHLAPEDWRRIERAVTGRRTTGIGTGRGDVAYIGDSENRDITAPATDEALRWEGWGTALKPGWEPIAVGRRPLAGTVAQNVLAHGTGAVNIDGCLVAHASAADLAESRAKNPGRGDTVTSGTYGAGRPQQSVNDAGRWPPNVALGPAAAAGIDRQGGGSASRIFPVFRYEAKASASERPRLADGTAHETVKPLDLMAWLVRLVTPPGGVVLDPFAGSGTTAEACVIEGFRCVLIEQDPKSAELIKARLSKPIQPAMFGLEAS